MVKRYRFFSRNVTQGVEITVDVANAYNDRDAAQLALARAMAKLSAVGHRVELAPNVTLCLSPNELSVYALADVEEI